MNLEKLFKMQKELDERILDRFPELRNEDLLDKKILALQVEIGELAQNWRGFKFWSEDREPRNYCMACDIPQVEAHDCHNPLLEEYVDCLHFILSIGLEIEADGEIRINPIRERFITEQFNQLFNKVGDFYRFSNKGNYFWIINLFIGLGEMLGFTWEQIETAYLEKNKINHQRQQENY